MWQAGRLTDEQISRCKAIGLSPNNKQAPSRPVACYETGEVFESITRAARMLGVDRKDLKRSIKGRYELKGRHYYYVDEAKPDPRVFIRRKKPVRCIETGEVFESRAAAARAVGVADTSLQSAIKRNGTSAGYHWKYVDSF